MKPEASLGARLEALLRHYLLPSTRRLCVGYSGGIDSQALLQALLRQALVSTEALPRIEAIHVHHGLHPQADRWVSHCQSFCAAASIPLKICYANPGDFPDLSPEAAAREARYLAFKSQLSEGDILVLGHHLDDQLETLLQRLCRGTGVLGLAGMSVYQPDHWPFAVLRPFLGLQLDRVDIEAYARSEQLQWIEDDSNTNARFDRNFVRHQVIPLLKSRWPKAAKAAQRSAQLCQEAANLCRQQALQDKAQVQYVPREKKHLLEQELSTIAVGESLSVKRLLTFPSQRRRDILRVWLQEKGFYSPSFAQLSRIEQEILGATKGGRPRLKIRDYVVGRWRDRLFIYRAVSPLVQ